MNQVKDINARLERIEPQQRSTDSHHHVVNEIKASNVNPKKSSPRAKTSTRENSLFAGSDLFPQENSINGVAAEFFYLCTSGDADITEKPIEPITVYSEKELIREFEKVASTLVPEKDWSLRISAMRRVEGLVAGGIHFINFFFRLLSFDWSP